MGQLRLPRRNTVSIATCALILLALALATAFSMLSVRHVAADTTCPCSIFSGATPSYGDYNDNSPLTLGVRFRPQINGFVTGVKFYKSPAMTTVHQGSLWDATGNLITTGTYSNETANGWQTLLFDTPVAVTANTTYTASYTTTGPYIATGSYFTATPIDNFPLLTLTTNQYDAASHQGNGVFALGNNVYPTNMFNGGNYWADVVFRASIDNSTPQVTNTNPANGATGVFTNANIVATFSHAMNSSTITTDTIKLGDSDGNPVAITVNYDKSTYKATITPSQPLHQNARYTLLIRGGVGKATDLDGTPLTSDYQTAFNTGADTCPCSIWNNNAPSGIPITFENTALTGGETFGSTVTSDENGYIHAIRFYKPLKSTATSHTVSIWSTTGVLLGNGTSSHETAYGWQEVALNSPVAVEQGTNYIISYYASDTIHIYTDDGLITNIGNGPLHAVAHGGWYYPGGDSFPNRNDGSNDDVNFWVDAVFSTSASYVAPFTVDVSQPTSDSYGVNPNTPLTFKFSNAVDSATVPGSVSLKDTGGSSVAGTTTYDDTEHTIVFQPNSPLARNQHYTATLSTDLHDIYGTALTPYAAPFTTGSALSTDITQGTGGPVLILTSASDPYGSYLTEILRSEGITYFTVKDVSQLSSATLDQYHMVLLAKSSLSSSQVSNLTNWVRSGGNLIAMQPDKQLASLLGLVDQNQSLSEGYIKIDTSKTAGKGVTSETMQYHGSADKYIAGNTTEVVATLFDNATTSTSNPAITKITVGSGHAAAFTYNLPKSIALTHQGNPSWAGQERDGDSPIRPNDLFNGNGSTDWLNTSKAHIPQADEQQQVLINMMLTMAAQDSPLPRFWILPHGLKAAVVMISDDHATSGATFDIFNDMAIVSPKNCSFVDWQCTRGSSLLYTTSGLTPSQANVAQSLGFSMGVHVQTGCGNYANYSTLASSYSSQIAGFQAKYTGITPQTFDRTHCYVWSDWDSVPKVDAATGIRINFNYELYPPSWTGANSGYLTGSGLTMRFTDINGHLLDVYQGVTDLDYETDPTSATMNTDFDNATNSNAFYGVFGTHYDTSGTDYYKLLMEAAQSHNIPMISASQLSTWKDALGSSTFTDISSSSSKLTFVATVAQGGEGTQAMIPAVSGNGALTSLKVNDTPVAYTTSVVKGVTYAIFDAQPGAYVALYGTTVPQDTTGSSGGSDSNSSGTRQGVSGGTKAYATIFDNTSHTTISTSPLSANNSQTPVDTKDSRSHTTHTDTNSSKSSALSLLKPLLIPAGVVIAVAAGGWWLAGAIRRRSKGKDTLF